MNPIKVTALVLVVFLTSISSSFAAPTSNYTAADYLNSFEKSYLAQDSAKKTEATPKKEPTTLAGGRVTMSGDYRMAAGIADDFILNNSNASFNLFGLQGPNSEYLFGENRHNTFDEAIYSQHRVNIDFAAKDKINFHMQVVNDPWSWVGMTGEQIQQSDPGDSSVHVRYNLKYFGANNSTLSEIRRTENTDRISIPTIKVHDGHTTRTRTVSMFGDPLVIPELDVDYEYRPIRKLWMDYNEENWQARIFLLADESQALTSDDPLGLSNHKDYWQQSPWLYQYVPRQNFIDLDGNNTMKRGYYSDSLSFSARDSEGNRLVLLRGATFHAEKEDTYFTATVAAPYTPWDEHYYKADNVPGALRIKHQFDEKLMVGGTYTFRSGMVDSTVADFAQTGGIDAKYQLDEHTAFIGEAAVSYRDQEQTAPERFQKSVDANAYKAAVESKFDHGENDHAELNLSYAQMGKDFQPLLSRYLSTRDDKFWGNHILFDPAPADVEPFRIGDGLDVNRSATRFQWKEKMFQERFYNLFDTRYVQKSDSGNYVETVVREEATYKFNSKLTGKALFRWRGLPKTTANVEPSLTAFYFPLGDIDPTDFTIRNTAIQADKDADQYTYSMGLEYVVNPQWTTQGIFERTNAIPDFPRGLLNDSSSGAVDRVDGILIDRINTFLYSQGRIGASAPYSYFNIYKGRVMYKPEESLAFTFHAAKNDYKFAGGIDDNITHAGVSAGYGYSKNLNFFMDYTFSKQVDVSEMVVSNVEDYRGHNNLYFSMDYRLKSSAILRAEYGVFGFGSNTPLVNPYSVTSFYLPTLDTEHLLRLSLNGEF